MTDPVADPAGPLPDGVYDIIVVDALADPDDPTRVTTVDVTVLAGVYKGETLTLGASGLAGSDIDLMGMPGTLAVTAGQPRITIEP